MNGKIIRRSIAVIVTLGLVLAGALTLWLRPWESVAATPQSGEGPNLITSEVKRGSLSSQMRLSGKLTYGEPQPLPASSGMLTALPAAGQTISQGQQVYEVDGKPVTLMRGERPFWRKLSTDSPNGEDIRQLQQNLADLGFYDDYIGVKYDWWTQRAVRAWQKSLGLEVTGEFDPASVAVVNASNIRIDRVTGELGQRDTSPATYTSPARQVQATLTDAQLNQLSPGQVAKIKLASGEELDAKISEVRPAVPAAEGKEEVKPTLIVDLPESEAVNQVTSPAAKITIPDEKTVEEALLVPVTALLAVADGQYMVEVERGGEVVRVPVEIGMVTDSTAQVVSSGGDGVAELKEGDQVVVSR